MFCSAWPWWLAVLLLAGGCSTTREITVSTRPDDASILIDGENLGHGPITHKFVFSSDHDQHDVGATRIGFKDQTIQLTRTYDADQLLIELRPQTRRVTFDVTPVPARLRVDGKLLGEAPISQISLDLEFTADAQGHWTTHTVTADRANWAGAQDIIKWEDASPRYTLTLQPMRKDVSINTNPAGAQVVLNGQSLGLSPVSVSQLPFAVDPQTGQFIPQQLSISKPGYDPYTAALAWDDGKADYRFEIPARTKRVHIITDPPGAAVIIDGHELSRDASGASATQLKFVPIDPRGTLPAFKAVVSKKAAEAEWYPKELSIGWDQGRAEYQVALREVRTRPVNLVEPQATRTDEGWRIAAHSILTLAMRDVTEPGDREQPTRISELAKGSVLDSLSISPDGSQLLYTTLWTAPSGDLRSRIDMMRTDGTANALMIGEETALSLMPSFTPDGSEILFSSNRATRRLSIWEMSAVGEAGITQLTSGEENALWPIADSSAKPRLFYGALVDTLPQPRLYMTRMGTVMRTDLARSGGMQPRINPKGDRLVYCGINEKTGKRQILIMGDRGGAPASIGDPDADEYDPVWSKDGGKIAFASNRGKDDEVGSNYDLWVIDLAHPDRPIQVTQNGSWDDRPQWDPSGKALYFRSNRGGAWGIWKIALPTNAAEGTLGAAGH